MCVVDSGVAANIDTRRVVARLSFDSAAGDDADQRYRHGTSMAMHMAAERNGEGMVGVWPLGELISYQVVPPGAAQARFVDYERAVRVCSEQASVAVIALAIADGQEPTGDEAARLQDALVHARANDIMVVASAGNSGGSVAIPRQLPGRLHGRRWDRCDTCTVTSPHEGQRWNYEPRGAGLRRRRRSR